MPVVSLPQLSCWIQETCQDNGVPELAPAIRVEYNNRFTSKIGDAHYRLNRIRLSRPLFELASFEECRNTVKHEACHLIVHYKWIQNKLVDHPKPHGWEWKQAMVRAGENPARCHKVDRGSLARVTRRYLALCKCEGDKSKHYISGQRKGKMKKGIGYRCKYCNALLALVY